MRPVSCFFGATVFVLAGCATPLQRAASQGHADRLAVLLKASPKPAKDDIGNALIQASMNGRDDAVRTLLDAGADVDFPNYKTGWSPLSTAAAHLHPSTVKLLLSRGAKTTGLPEFLDQYGWPAGAQLLRDIARPELAAASAPGNAAVAPQPSQSAPAGSDVDQADYSVPENPDNFAVIVGIEKYSSLPEAQYAAHDAQAVKTHLLALGYPERNIKMLVDSKATNGGLAEKLGAWLPRNVGENSTVFFYFSGHGAPDPQTGEAYLVPWDGDPQSLEDTAYPLMRLYAKLGALKAKRVIVALDSCFSGAGGRSVLPKGARPLVNKIVVSRPVDGRAIVFAASAANEISGTIGEQEHGAFTYYFLKGLNGGGIDGAGRVTAKSLYDFLAPKVRDAAARQDRDQTPQLIENGDASASVPFR